MLENILFAAIVSEIIISLAICILIQFFLLQHRFKLKDWQITALVSVGGIMPHNNLTVILGYYVMMIACYWIKWYDCMLISILAIFIITFYQRRIVSDFRNMWRT